MYIFRIVSPIDKTKSWYQGEFVTSTALGSVFVTDPVGYPPIGTSVLKLGDSVEYQGYTYSSLKDNNTDIPGLNYLGYPVPQAKDSDAFGRNSWIRTGYANNVLMLVPESCGITESYSTDIIGTIAYPTQIPYVDVDKCSCVLFCGVLGATITVDSKVITNIDVNDYEIGIGNPETSGLNTAFTMSKTTTGGFSFTITKSLNSISTYCSGAYIGSWSYLGITQWTNHKKSTNDYSRQEQDEWGNYELSKNRTGRTYSADVVLTPRAGAVPGDYDYSLKDLCYSVLNLLQSQLGAVNGYYFNNQDIGVPWIAHNQSQDNNLVQLNDSDIIVGILKNFKITDITGNKAILNLTIDSVPNEYKNYITVSEELPEIAPEVPDAVICTQIDTINIATNLVIINGGTITIPLGEVLQNRIKLVPIPGNAPFDIGSFVISEGIVCFEYDVINSGDNKIIRLKGTKVGQNLVRIQPRAFTENNTYGDMMAHIFYIKVVEP